MDEIEVTSLRRILRDKVRKHKEGAQSRGTAPFVCKGTSWGGVYSGFLLDASLGLFSRQAQHGGDHRAELRTRLERRKCGLLCIAWSAGRWMAGWLDGMLWSVEHEWMNEFVLSASCSRAALTVRAVMTQVFPLPAGLSKWFSRSYCPSSAWPLRFIKITWRWKRQGADKGFHTHRFTCTHA